MNRLLSLSAGKKVACLAFAVGTLLGSRYLTASARTEGLSFAGTEEFRRFAEKHGFHLHCGNGMGFFGSCFYVADRPLSLKTLESVQWKHDCGRTAAWKGILWISYCDPMLTDRDVFSGEETLPAVAVSGHWRLWGNVLAAGDPDMLDRLESLVRGR